jgi:chromosome partitioning protein
MIKSRSKTPSKTTQTPIIAIINNKGGVGKTTTVAHIAYALQQRGKSVLAIDMDSQANLLMHFFPKKTVREERETQTAIAPKPLHHKSGVDILALSFWQPQKSKDFTQEIQHYAKAYDVVLLDCPPSLEERTIAALDAAESVLIPTEAEHFSVEGIKTLLAVLETRTVKILGILVTKFNKKTVAHTHLLNHLHNTYSDYMMQPVIAKSDTFVSASTQSMTAFEWNGARKNAALEGYEDVAKIIEQYITEGK